MLLISFQQQHQAALSKKLKELPEWELATWPSMIGVRDSHDCPWSSSGAPSEGPAPVYNLKGRDSDLTPKVAKLGQHIYNHIKYSYEDGVEVEKVTSHGTLDVVIHISRAFSLFDFFDPHHLYSTNLATNQQQLDFFFLFRLDKTFCRK